MPSRAPLCSLFLVLIFASVHVAGQPETVLSCSSDGSVVTTAVLQVRAVPGCRGTASRCRRHPLPRQSADAAAVCRFAELPRVPAPVMQGRLAWGTNGTETACRFRIGAQGYTTQLTSIDALIQPFFTALAIYGEHAEPLEKQLEAIHLLPHCSSQHVPRLAPPLFPTSSSAVCPASICASRPCLKPPDLRGHPWARRRPDAGQRLAPHQHRRDAIRAGLDCV